MAQNVLKGIGISIDSTIISKQKRKGHKIPRTDCFWIRSFFVADIDKISEITTFFDLQISQDENDLTAYLDYTLREYRKANIKSKRYGRYAEFIIYAKTMCTLVRMHQGLVIYFFTCWIDSTQKMSEVTLLKIF